MKVIAYTLGIDPVELSDYRYQPGRTRRAIYGIGEHFYCQGKTPPTDLVDRGAVWERHADQFWAERARTVLWVTLNKAD
jgi:hypothetical protein